jgi:tetratricopeptide (TPR) repeat protein
LNPDGSEIDRIFGWKNDKEKYYNTIVDYTNGINTVSDILSKVKQSPEDVSLNYRMAKKYEDRRESTLAQPYYANVLKLDPDDQFGYATDCNEYMAVHQLFTNGDDVPLVTLLKEISEEKYIDLGYDALIEYYERNHLQEKTLSAFEAVIEILPENADYMNRYAWYIYENKIKDQYDKGIEYATKALEIRPDAANIWDTLSWLEFENGQIEDAIKHMEKAVQLNPEREYFKENLEKMRDTLRTNVQS